MNIKMFFQKKKFSTCRVLHADNNPTTNGATTNGVGVTTSGATTNGETTNGATTNGETTNGATTNGVGVTTDGATTNGGTQDTTNPEGTAMQNTNGSQDTESEQNRDNSVDTEDYALPDRINEFDSAVQMSRHRPELPYDPDSMLSLRDRFIDATLRDNTTWNRDQERDTSEYFREVENDPTLSQAEKESRKLERLLDDRDVRQNVNRETQEQVQEIQSIADQEIYDMEIYGLARDANNNSGNNHNSSSTNGTTGQQANGGSNGTTGQQANGGSNGTTGQQANSGSNGYDGGDDWF